MRLTISGAVFPGTPAVVKTPAKSGNETLGKRSAGHTMNFIVRESS